MGIHTKIDDINDDDCDFFSEQENVIESINNFIKNNKSTIEEELDIALLWSFDNGQLTFNNSNSYKYNGDFIDHMKALLFVFNKFHLSYDYFSFDGTCCSGGGIWYFKVELYDNNMHVTECSMQYTTLEIKLYENINNFTSPKDKLEYKSKCVELSFDDLK